MDTRGDIKYYGNIYVYELYIMTRKVSDERSYNNKRRSRTKLVGRPPTASSGRDLNAARRKPRPLFTVGDGRRVLVREGRFIIL